VGTKTSFPRVFPLTRSRAVPKPGCYYVDGSCTYKEQHGVESAVDSQYKLNWDVPNPTQQKRELRMPWRPLSKTEKRNPLQHFVSRIRVKEGGEKEEFDAKANQKLLYYFISRTFGIVQGRTTTTIQRERYVR
jgi:hypothetical protein